VTSQTLIFCPACGARYTVERELLDGAGLRVLCGTCGGGFRADEAKQQAVPKEAKAPLELLAAPRVVVGHAVPSAARTVAGVLKEGGYAPVLVKSGEQVLQAIDPALPAPCEAVVLDVGIGGVLAFEVIEHLRAHPDTQRLPVVLLASVYERTRYKRRPNQLYGADAYLELHHIPDRLVRVLDALRAGEVAPETWLQAPADRARAAPLRGQPPMLDEQGKRVLARRLLSDVALYHGDEVARGVAEGAPLAYVGDAVEAARQLFEETCGDRDGLFATELEELTARLNERRRVRREADA
jgi:predicted Zn finger-like uncharacterized protein